MEIQQKINIRGTMRTMEIGDSFSLPIRIYNGGVIRAAASQCGLEYEMFIKVHLDREEGCYKITRLA